MIVEFHTLNDVIGAVRADRSRSPPPSLAEREDTEQPCARLVRQLGGAAAKEGHFFRERKRWQLCASALGRPAGEVKTAWVADYCDNENHGGKWSVKAD